MAKGKSNTTKIDANSIQSAILYKQGLTAELAVLSAFGCDLQVVFSLSHLRRYINDPKEYVEDCIVEYDVPKSFKGLALTESSIKHHASIIDHMSSMRTLRKQLLTDSPL